MYRSVCTATQKANHSRQSHGIKTGDVWKPTHRCCKRHFRAAKSEEETCTSTDAKRRTQWAK